MRSHPYPKAFSGGERKVFLLCGKCGKKFERQFTSEVIQLARIRVARWESRCALRQWTWHSLRNGEEINRAVRGSERRNRRERWLHLNYFFEKSNSYKLRRNHRQGGFINSPLSSEAKSISHTANSKWVRVDLHNETNQKWSRDSDRAFYFPLAAVEVNFHRW